MHTRRGYCCAIRAWLCEPLDIVSSFFRTRVTHGCHAACYHPAANMPQYTGNAMLLLATSTQPTVLLNKDLGFSKSAGVPMMLADCSDKHPGSKPDACSVLAWLITGIGKHLRLLPCGKDTNSLYSRLPPAEKSTSNLV